MNYGKLRCLGSQNKLKAHYGTGYQLHINCHPGRLSGGCGYCMSYDPVAPPLTDIQQFISSHLPSATVVEVYASEITCYIMWCHVTSRDVILHHVMSCYTCTGKICYKIDKNYVVVSKLFTLLNSAAQQLGISDWGIKRTTLEDGNVLLYIAVSHVILFIL